MLQLIESQVIDITPQALADFRALPPVLGERPLKPSRVQDYVTQIRNNNFNFPTWGVIRDTATGQCLRVNGQHTSAALALIPEAEFPPHLRGTYEVYDSDDIAMDAPLLFAKYDNSKAARTSIDWMAQYAASFPDLKLVPPVFLVKATNGIQFLIRVQLAKNPAFPLILFSPHDHGLHFKSANNRAFALWLHQWIKTKNEWMLGNAGVVAEMYADWQVQPKTATEFWDYVLKENHPEPDHDTRQLADQFSEWQKKARKVKPSQFRIQANRVWRIFNRGRQAEIQGDRFPLLLEKHGSERLTTTDHL